MIVDWYDNCIKIHKKHKLSTIDPSDRKYSIKQEVVYLMYLSSMLHFTKYLCYINWCAILNGTASVYCNDLEEQQAVFDRLWSKAQKHKYSDVCIAHRLKPIRVFQDEVDYINSLHAPLWVKQYWMCLLCYYKFAVQLNPNVQKTQTLNAWCIRQVDYKKKSYGGKCQDLIAEWMRRNDKVVISTYASSISKDRNPLYKPTFLVNEGVVAATCNKISGIKRLLKLVTNDVNTCTICGQPFYAGAKTKRTMCETCYEKHRKEQKANYIRLKRSQEKASE